MKKNLNKACATTSRPSAISGTAIRQKGKTMADDLSQAAIAAAQRLADAVDALSFAPPTTHVYNPLRYAWPGHRSYLEQHAKTKKKVIFMGMNPGPYGMAQTGVPFGEIAHARDWVGVEQTILSPDNAHPKRPIEGFACQRSEVSGRRLWGLFSEHYADAAEFFVDHFVANYCPLVFMEASGKNRTPDKLPAAEITKLYAVCDQHLRDLVDLFEPEWVIGVGAFAETRTKEALLGYDLKIGRILHPSPASPAANRGWSEQAEAQLKALGVW
jgi:single-strand selective monofunctional uracil DNA glycosylase